MIASILVRLRVRPATCLIASLAAGALARGGHAAAAQEPGGGAVVGQVTILERDGARTTDLANAVVWLEPVAGAGAGSAPTSSAQIVMESRQYVPRVRVVAAGSSVGFPNQDPFRHNVFSKAGPSEFDLGLYGRGETRQARFERAGIYPVFCNVHPKMVAFVVAVGTSHVTRPGPDGRFAIPGVPAGSYRLRVWHDRGGEHSSELSVAAEGRAGVGVQLDARGYRFVQHRNKFGQEYTDGGRDRY